jgi:DNA-binding MarR family transcriptional regulator
MGSGVHAQQFTTLAILEHTGPQSLSELAEQLAMDRTTLTRKLKPLQRDDIITITPHEDDRRIRMISITGTGSKKLKAARIKWREAQAEFERRFGAERAATLRAELRAAAAAVAS